MITIMCSPAWIAAGAAAGASGAAERWSRAFRGSAMDSAGEQIDTRLKNFLEVTAKAAVVDMGRRHTAGFKRHWFLGSFGLCTATTVLSGAACVAAASVAWLCMRALSATAAGAACRETARGSLRGGHGAASVLATATLPAGFTSLVAMTTGAFGRTHVVPVLPSPAYISTRDVMCVNMHTGIKVLVRNIVDVKLV